MLLFNRRPLLLATLFVAAVCVSIVAIETWRIVAARGLQVADRETDATNLAKSLAQHASGTFMQADALLSGLVERLEHDGTGTASLERIHRLLRTQKGELPQLQRLSVLDADGRWLVTDVGGLDRSVSHSEREYFRHHLAHRDGAPHLGPPIRSRSTNEWIVTISRRFDQPDGRFGGVVLASIHVRFFNAHFDQLDIGRDGAILFVMSDGTILDRRPFREDVIGTSIADGPLFRQHIAFDDHDTTWITSRFDGVERLTAFQKLDRFPAFAVVALSKNEVLERWRADSIVHGAAALVLAAILAAIGARLVRQIARRDRDRALLVESRTQLVAANAKLEDLAREDGLTGIANRRELDRVLDDEAQRVGRTRRTLAMLMIDIDHFKAYNDALGHLGGDECLRRVAAQVDAQASRPGDLAARYGGEEFVVLLPATDLEGARAVAERIRAALHRCAWPHPGSRHGIVTASIGVAVLEPEAGDASARALIERADRALYAAKETGRDAIRVFVDDGGSCLDPRSRRRPAEAAVASDVMALG